LEGQKGKAGNKMWKKVKQRLQKSDETRRLASDKQAIERYVTVPQFPMSVNCHFNKYFHATAVVLEGFEIPSGFRTTWFNLAINVVNLQHYNI
jgi:hypothetical protein